MPIANESLTQKFDKFSFELILILEDTWTCHLPKKSIMLIVSKIDYKKTSIKSDQYHVPVQRSRAISSLSVVT